MLIPNVLCQLLGKGKNRIFKSLSLAFVLYHYSLLILVLVMNHIVKR